MSLEVSDKFQHMLRFMNTNVDGRTKVVFAMTGIKGVGRRFATLVCKKADVDLKKRAGELTDGEVERIQTIMQNPRQYKIPNYFLNRQKDVKDGKYLQLLANNVDNKLREDLERMRKIRSHRGLRHYWGIRVRGQHTKTTGRRGRTVGVAKFFSNFSQCALLWFSLSRQPEVSGFKANQVMLCTAGRRSRLLLRNLVLTSFTTHCGTKALPITKKNVTDLGSVGSCRPER